MSLINTTADGFVDAQYTVIDAEFYDFTHNLLSDTETIAFGRNTFEMFQERWPSRLVNVATPDWQIKMARALNDKPKVVYSSTLRMTTWKNSTIIPQINIEHINTYKQKTKGGLLTIGSPNLVASLTKMNLIDEYYVCIHPLIAGASNTGIRLFDKINLESSRPLKYVDGIQLKSGVHIMHYQSVY